MAVPWARLRGGLCAGEWRTRTATFASFAQVPGHFRGGQCTDSSLRNRNEMLHQQPAIVLCEHSDWDISDDAEKWRQKWHHFNSKHSFQGISKNCEWTDSSLRNRNKYYVYDHVRMTYHSWIWIAVGDSFNNKLTNKLTSLPAGHWLLISSHIHSRWHLGVAQ